MISRVEFSKLIPPVDCLTGKQPWSGIVLQHSDFSAWFVKGKNSYYVQPFGLKRRVP